MTLQARENHIIDPAHMNEGATTPDGHEISTHNKKHYFHQNTVGRYFTLQAFPPCSSTPVEP